MVYSVQANVWFPSTLHFSHFLEDYFPLQGKRSRKKMCIRDRYSIETAVWEKVMDNTEVKKYPKKEMRCV